MDSSFGFWTLENVIISAWAAERHWCFDGAWDLSLWCVGFPPWPRRLLVPFILALTTDSCEHRLQEGIFLQTSVIDVMKIANWFQTTGSSSFFPSFWENRARKCKLLWDRSGRLWKVQVRSRVSINISWCFSLESGYKLIPPLAEMFTRTSEVPSFASSPNCPNWVWFDYFFQWHPRRASFADIRAHHFYWGANMWPELCPWLEALPHISQSLSVLSHPALSLWGCEKLICLDPLTLAEGLLYQRTVPWMNDLGFSPVTGHQKHYSHFRLHGKIY